MALDLTPENRRLAVRVLLGVAGLAFLLALVPTLLASPSAGTFLLLAVVLLALALVALLVVLLWGETESFDEEGPWTEEEARLDEPEAREILLRCKRCEEVFPVLDDGTRPLRHTCPRCGTSGVLRDVPSRA